MRLWTAERQVVVTAFAARYRASSTGGGTGLRDECVAMTGYNRSYASWLVRMRSRRVRLGGRVVVVGGASRRVRQRRRQPRYGPELVTALTRMWKPMDEMWGTRLKAALPQVMAALERHGQLGLDRGQRERGRRDAFQCELVADQTHELFVDLHDIVAVPVRGRRTHTSSVSAGMTTQSRLRQRTIDPGFTLQVLPAVAHHKCSWVRAADLQLHPSSDAPLRSNCTPSIWVPRLVGYAWYEWVWPPRS